MNLTVSSVIFSSAAFAYSAGGYLPHDVGRGSATNRVSQLDALSRAFEYADRFEPPEWL